MTEAALQKQVVDTLKLGLSPAAYLLHVPNGGSRNVIEAAKLKGMGVRPGVPDLLVVYGGRAHFLELKTAKGRIKPAQLLCHQELREAGADVAICRSLEDVLSALRRWGVPCKARVAA